MKKTLLPYFVLFITFLIFSIDSYAYKVRIGTNLWFKSMADHPENWALTAAGVDEISPAFDSFSASTDLSKTVNAGEVRLTAQSTEWRTIINQFNAEAKKHAETSIMRTAWQTDYFPDRWPLPEYLIRQPFSPTNKIESFGCTLESVMFFDNAVNSDPGNYPTYNWTTAEVQELRDWLDTHNRKDVKISYDARNNSAGVRAWVFSDIVDEIHFEGGPEVFITNFGSRQQLLKDVWNNTNKRIVLMIPVYGFEKNNFKTILTTQADITKAYIQIRASIKWLGEFMGPEFLKSDRVIIYPTTYFETIAFYPELDSQNKYTNTITGITLSFIEQREQFEAGTADPESYVRAVQPQKIIFPQIPTKIVTENDFSLNAKVNTNFPLVYSSSNPLVATITPSGTIHIVGVGTTDITVTQAGSAIYNAASATQLLTVVPSKIDQTITFPEIPTKLVNDVHFATATTDSNLPITYSSSNTSVAKITNGEIDIVGAGTAIITASQGGNNTYNAATSVTQTLTVLKTEQTIRFYPLATVSTAEPDFAPGFSTSGLPLTYTSSNPLVASITSSGTIHIEGTGTTIITASQLGNNNYEAATSVSQTLVVKMQQTISFIPYELAKFKTGETDFIPATTNSGKPITLKSYTKTIATVVNGKIHIVGAVGESKIGASISENELYAATNEFFTTLKVYDTKQAQTITFNAIATKAVGNADFSPAWASSKLPITYTSSNENVATVVNGKIHIVGGGTSEITASQSGNLVYNAAISATRTLTVSGTALPPTNLKFVCPTTDTIVTNLDSFYVEAQATISSGTIENVKLFVDNNLVREITTAPYIWNNTKQDPILSNLTVGKKTLKIVALNSFGVKDSVSVNVTVSEVVLPKTSLKFVFPTTDTVIINLDSFYVEAQASISSGTIENVNLYLDNVLVRKITTAPYIWNNTKQDPILSNLTDGKNTLKVVAFNSFGVKDSVSVIVTVSENTTIPTSNNSKFEISPNPASDIVFIKIQNIDANNITVFNTYGLKVLDKTITSTENNIFILQVKNLPIGIYFVRIKDATNNVYTKKMIIN